MTNLSSIPGFSAASSGGGGGGGGSSTSNAIKPTILYDTDQVGTWESGWDEIPSYTRVHQYSPRGQFAIHSHTFSSGAQGGPNYQSNRLRIAPFTVNQSTGAMTFGSKSNAFINTSGYVHSTQSYGFHGTYGVNWGNSAWGSGNSHYQGGCVWRIVNNAVVGGQSSGNNSYASENTSNGMLAVYENSGTTYYNIPNGTYTSIGSISSSGTNSDWATASETNHSSATYIYRCVGNTVGENHAGLLVTQAGIVAMNATGSGSTTGSTFSEGGNQAQNGGLGFELDSGAQVYFTNKGTYIRGSRTGGITYKATVTEYGTSGTSIPSIAASGTDLSKVGITNNSLTYQAGGYPAKEADTFYFYSGTTKQELVKFKIRNPSAGNITLERLGAVDLSDIAGNTDINSYSGLVDITGNQDQFIVCSYRSQSYQPSYTIVVDNPIKDA